MPTDRADEQAKVAAPLPDRDLWLLIRHDLRQWSQSLLGLAPSIGLATDPFERKELQHVISGVAQTFARMMDLLNLLAEDGRMGDGSPVPRTPLNALASRFDAAYGALVSKLGARLNIAELEGVVAADARLVEAAVSGLLLTAAKLRQSGEIALRSQIGRDGMTVSTSVHFCGIDPSPGLIPQAFVELPAMPDAPDKPFVGFGIELIAEVARRCGGKLLITSERGGGWRMKLILPALPIT